MAYTPREIKDRIAVGDDIFIVEDLGDNKIRLMPAPTYVSEAGTPVNKALLQHMENHLFPPGGIIMWSGAINDIPVGWGLCNGSNGTPDLRNRFVVGAGSSYSVGNTGGSNTVTLNASQIPSHGHGAGDLKADTAGSHTHGYWTADRTSSAGGLTSGYLYTLSYEQTSTGGTHTHTISGDTADTGGGRAHENRPPYYALAYIMKL